MISLGFPPGLPPGLPCGLPPGLPQGLPGLPVGLPPGRPPGLPPKGIQEKLSQKQPVQKKFDIQQYINWTVTYILRCPRSLALKRGF